jgi:hypothetical protein
MYSLSFSDLGSGFGGGGVKAKVCPEGQIPINHKGVFKCESEADHPGSNPCPAGTSWKRWVADGKKRSECVPSTSVAIDPVTRQQLPHVTAELPTDLTPMTLPSESEAVTLPSSAGLPIWVWGTIAGGVVLALLGGVLVIKRRRANKKSAAVVAVTT